MTLAIKNNGQHMAAYNKTHVSHDEYMMFGLSCKFIRRSLQLPNSQCWVTKCYANKFYLNVPNIARFLALPKTNRIFIEATNLEVNDDVLKSWLLGTVFAYMLQYHDYIVLHGSAVMMNDSAVIFSGQSGAGKSTIASALIKKGYPLITDDLVVIKRNVQNQYCIIPGPAQLKLCQDAIDYFDYDSKNASSIFLQRNKYAFPVSQMCKTSMIPISAFYELNWSDYTSTYVFNPLDSMETLKTLMQNAYRYFMLQPLGKLESFFYGCAGMTKQFSAYKLFRPAAFELLSDMIAHIEYNQGCLNQ